MFLYLTPKAKLIKGKIGPYPKKKNFCEHSVMRSEKDKLHTGRKQLQVTYLTKGLYLEYITYSQNSTLKIKNTIRK